MVIGIQLRGRRNVIRSGGGKGSIHAFGEGAQVERFRDVAANAASLQVGSGRLVAGADDDRHLAAPTAAGKARDLPPRTVRQVDVEEDEIRQ